MAPDLEPLAFVWPCHFVCDTACMRADEGIAVVGAGKMGEILACGMVRSGKRRPEQICLADIDAGRVNALVRAHGFRSAGGNREAVSSAGLVLLAVKPQDIAGVLEEVSSAIGPDHLVLSIAAGIATKFIEDRLQPGSVVVRAMPNAAAQVGQGITAIAPGTNAAAGDLDAAEELLSGAGPVVRVAEGDLDAVTALSGSGPAYFALFTEAMIDAGVTAGLGRSLSAALVVQTMLGTAAMLTEGEMKPAEVREAVTSPGGTTSAGLRELERAGVRGAILDAVLAALDRSRALG